MNVVEASPDNLGRWFIRTNDEGTETFAARLLYRSDELGVAWAETIPQIAMSIAEIQAAIDRKILRISGTASNGIEDAIVKRRFNSNLYSRRLSRHLGGEWRVEVVRRSGVCNEVWDIIAMRVGG